MKDYQIAISIHAYAPYYFTMASDEYASYSFPGKNGWGEDYEENLTTLFSNIKQLMAEKNVPFLMTEFGASDRNNDEDRARWVTCYLNLANDAGIPCFWWDNQSINGNGEFECGLLHRKSGKWFEDSIPVIKAMMKIYGVTGDIPQYKLPQRTGFPAGWQRSPCR